jgi:hypothetical protein
VDPSWNECPLASFGTNLGGVAIELVCQQEHPDQEFLQWRASNAGHFMPVHNYHHKIADSSIFKIPIALSCSDANVRIAQDISGLDLIRMSFTSCLAIIRLMKPF